MFFKLIYFLNLVVKKKKKAYLYVCVCACVSKILHILLEKLVLYGYVRLCSNCIAHDIITSSVLQIWCKQFSIASWFSLFLGMTNPSTKGMFGMH
jgi:hypothetical protein